METVSVVIPTYNRENTLPRSIDSVLRQTYRNFELIIVDDASTDSTEEIVQSYTDDRVKYLKHKTNRNGSAARNTGINAASGDYIAFLDSDDEWHKKKLERQVYHLQNKSNEWIGSYCGVDVNRGSKIKEVIANIFDNDAKCEGQEDIVRNLLTLKGLVHGGSTLLARRDPIRSIGGFDEDFDRHQDIEFVVRLAKRGKIAYLDENLVKLHESGNPCVEDIASAKKNLFDKFSEDITRLESNGHHIHKGHKFVLARHYIRSGNLRDGINNLKGSYPPTMRHLIGLGPDVVQGLKVNIDHEYL